MYPTDSHSIVIRSIADLFDNINGRNRSDLANIITSRAVVGAVFLTEEYKFKTPRFADTIVTVAAVKGIFSEPAYVNNYRLCFTLAQLSSLVFMRADLAEKFNQMVLDFKITAPHPTGIMYAGGDLMLTY